jgi:anti-sigma B factor antagonist
MPSLVAKHRQAGPISIVDLRGPVSLGETSLLLRRTIHELLEGGRTKIILNFQEVTLIDSAGIGELAGAYQPLKSRGAKLKLLNPPKKIQGLLQITQLDKVFEVYTDEQIAIRSFTN